VNLLANRFALWNVAANGWQPAHEGLVAACGIAASVALVLASLPPDRYRRFVLARSGAPRDILRAERAAARR
jgi:hypothetical protein